VYRKLHRKSKKHQSNHF